MAKQAIGIGTSANDGTGDPLRTAMDKTNDNFNEVYALFGNGSTLAISGDATVSAGALTIANDAVENAMIADNAVKYDQLGVEFTDIQALSSSAVDWSAATVFTKTISGTEALTFSNVSTGMTISLVLTGGTTVTLPTSVNLISGTYDPAVPNLIQITSTNGSTEQWAIISKPAK